MLLHWAIGIFRPAKSTGANGEPVATIARPSVHRTKSSGTASHRSVGFDGGKMIGRSTLRAISRTIDSVKAPPRVDRPIKIVASTLRMTVSKSIVPDEGRRHGTKRSTGWA